MVRNSGRALVCLCLTAACHKPMDRAVETEVNSATTGARLEIRARLALPEGESIELALVSAGEFLMGSPEEESGRDPDEKRHRVRISRAFYMGRHEVTQAQWRAVMGDNPSFYRDDPRLPVDSVDWKAALEFCHRLVRLTSRAVRLPTEAEWESACRAGTTTAFSFGRDINEMDANYDWSHDGATGEDAPESTSPVGSFAANPWGLYDMHGNVKEWCSDWYGPYDASVSPVVDPVGPASGQQHVLRGGSWDDYGRRSRSASRHGHRPGDRDETVGFRVVVEDYRRK